MLKRYSVCDLYNRRVEPPEGGRTTPLNGLTCDCISSVGSNSHLAFFGQRSHDLSDLSHLIISPPKIFWQSCHKRCFWPFNHKIFFWKSCHKICFWPSRRMTISPQNLFLTILMQKKNSLTYIYKSGYTCLRLQQMSWDILCGTDNKS